MTKIILKDFQAHDETVLDLKGGFAAILGPTNSGKSSVVRSLRWLFYDSIKGKRFIRHGQQTAKVQVDFDDVSVERTKGAKENRYRVGSMWLDSIGTGAPPEVQKATGISPFVVDKDVDLELNVSQQHRSPFLLMETDSVKNKFLNSLTGGHVFDAAIRETQRILKATETQQKNLETTIEATSQQLATFVDLEAQERKINELEGLIGHYETVVQKIRTLSDLQSTRTKLVTEQITVDISLKKIDWALNQVVPQCERLSWVETTLGVLTTYSNLHRQADEYIRGVDVLDQQILKIKGDLLALPDSVCGECGQVVTRQAREALVK